MALAVIAPRRKGAAFSSNTPAAGCERGRVTASTRASATAFGGCQPEGLRELVSQARMGRREVRR